MLQSLYNLHELESEAPGLYTEETATVKCQLQQFDAERFRAARVRSRSNRALHSEEPTRRALIDECRHVASKRISELYCGAALVKSTDKIVEFANRYTSLFAATSTAADKAHVTRWVTMITPLSEDECTEISDPLTLGELEYANDQLPLSKTPRPDGISGEFYKTFKSVLSLVLLQILETSLDAEFMLQSFTENHIVLIPKADDEENSDL